MFFHINAKIIVIPNKVQNVLYLRALGTTELQSKWFYVLNHKKVNDLISITWNWDPIYGNKIHILKKTGSQNEFKIPVMFTYVLKRIM